MFLTTRLRIDLNRMDFLESIYLEFASISEAEFLRPLLVHLENSAKLNKSLVRFGENPRIPKALLAFHNFSLGALQNSKSGEG